MNFNGTVVTALYSYLNLESTKTSILIDWLKLLLYSYLNLESTKTFTEFFSVIWSCTVT